MSKTQSAATGRNDRETTVGKDVRFAPITNNNGDDCRPWASPVLPCLDGSLRAGNADGWGSSPYPVLPQTVGHCLCPALRECSLPVSLVGRGYRLENGVSWVVPECALPAGLIEVDNLSEWGDEGEDSKNISAG